MSCGPSDTFKVVVFARNPETLLTGGGSFIRKRFKPQKHVFKRHHPGVYKKKGRVVFWYYRSAFYNGMSFIFKKR